MKTVLAPILLGFLLAGCRNPAPGYTPVPSKPVVPVSAKEARTPQALFPLGKGSVWTYTMRSQTYQGDRLDSEGTPEIVEYRVTDVSPAGDVTLTLERMGLPIDRQVWRVTPTALYQVASGLQGVPFRPVQPLVLLPLDAGRRFRWEGSGMSGPRKVGRSRVTSEVLAPQAVDTDMGRLSAVPIASRTEYEGGWVENTSWFRPGVGLVRLRQETPGGGDRRDVLVLTLKTYALKRP